MGLQKTSKDSAYYFMEPTAEEGVSKDTLPEGVTEEELKEQYGKLVWCEYYECKWNKQTGAERQLSTLLKNKTYKGFKDDDGMKGLCGRPDEIAIRFKTIVSGSQKYKVPACFCSNTKITGHIDFSKLLQPDGSPWGGNIDSGHPSDAGYGGLDPNNIHGG
tara:strand:+ start:3221 stop:3703 length:483 start_codon:yes stop_codon:yes gene_type:complete